MSSTVHSGNSVHSNRKARRSSPQLAVLNGGGAGYRSGSPNEGTRVRSSSLNKAENNINLNTVRKIDSCVCELLKTVPQVAVYQYLESANNWERNSVEGTLFIYSRSSPPSHGFVVLNRLSSDNLLQLIPANLPVHVQVPFVLFKRDDDIFGLCFIEEQLCHEIGQLLTRLSQTDCDAPSRATSAPVPPSSSSSSSIVSSEPSSERLTPSPSQSVAQDKAQQRKEHARKVRLATSRRSSEQNTASSKKKEVRRDQSPSGRSKNIVVQKQARLSPQPGQTSSYSARKASKQAEKNLSASFTGSSSPLARELLSDFTDGNHDLAPSSTCPPPALQSLFAQVAISSPPMLAPVSKEPASITPLRVLSHAELEKQMSSEVPSPDAKSGPVPLPVFQHNSSLVEQQQLLMQPALFSSSSPKSTSLPSSSSSSTAPPGVHVQPPTPVAPYPPLQAPTTQLFPSIPPLVHSPGMRAAPISSSKHAVTTHSPLLAGSQPTSYSHGVTSNKTTSNLSPVLSRRTQDPVRSSSPSSLHNGYQPSQSLVNQAQSSPPNNASLSSSLCASNLMSPGMFQQRSQTDPLPHSESSNEQPLVAGLTRSQLQQALLHLIKSDESFIDTLHKSYIDSLRVGRL